MSHPQCCKDPEGCDLPYVEHLRGVALGVEAIPTRAVHRSPGVHDELAVETTDRCRRWEADANAYKQLRRAGLEPRHVLGSRNIVKELGG